MSIPAVIGANILSLADAVKAGIDWSMMPAYLVGVIVAAVSGYCIGGGFEIAMCCDMIYASDDARFGLPESNLGLRCV